MSMNPACPEHLPSSITERLDELLAQATELQAMLPGDLPALSLRQLVQINRARMDFERFSELLVSELSNVLWSVTEALSIVDEARSRTVSSRDFALGDPRSRPTAFPSVGTTPSAEPSQRRYRAGKSASR
jgi:hypothetical protein